VAFMPAVVIVVVIAHDKSPWTPDWVCGDVIGGGRVLFPPVSDQPICAMTIS
jgi:hypothetical protein